MLSEKMALLLLQLRGLAIALLAPLHSVGVWLKPLPLGECRRIQAMVIIVPEEEAA